MDGDITHEPAATTAAPPVIATQEEPVLNGYVSSPHVAHISTVALSRLLSHLTL